MSLINQMLRDLDERQASSLERGALAEQVRALPREKRFPWLNVLPVVLGIAIGAIAIWLAFDVQQPSVPEPTAAPAATPAAATTSVAMTLPPLVVPMPAEPAEAMAEQATAEVSAVEQTRRPVTESLQLDTQLSPVSRRAETVPAATPVATPVAQIQKRPLTADAETADGEYRKAMAAYRQGRSQEAIDGFRSSLRIDPRNITARQSLLSLLLDQQRWPDAKTVAVEGLALHAGQPGWAMILARLQVEQGQLAEAEQTMAAHAQYGERSADYLAFHGLLLEKLQRPQEARAVFTKARDLGNLPPDLAAAIDQRLR